MFHFDGITNTNEIINFNGKFQFVFNESLNNPIKRLIYQQQKQNQRFEIMGDYLPDGFYFEFGCFSDDNDCVTSLNNNFKSKSSI